MKKYLTGLVAGMALMFCLPVMAETAQNIEGAFRNATLVIDGKTLEDDIILYSGTAYIPARAVAEALNGEIAFEASSQTVFIDSKRYLNELTEIEELREWVKFAKFYSFYGDWLTDMAYGYNSLFIEVEKALENPPLFLNGDWRANFFAIIDSMIAGCDDLLDLDLSSYPVEIVDSYNHNVPEQVRIIKQALALYREGIEESDINKIYEAIQLSVDMD